MSRAIVAMVVVTTLAAAAAPLLGQQRDTAQRVPPATVTDAAEQLPGAFLRRSKVKGGGRFLTTKDVAAYKAANTVQLLSRVSGGNVRDIGSGQLGLVGSRGSRNTTMASVENELCLIGLAVNDSRVAPGFDMASIRPEDIIAVEFYRGPATIPPEFGGTSAEGTGCGLLVVWTNEGRRSLQFDSGGTPR